MSIHREIMYIELYAYGTKWKYVREKILYIQVES